MIRELPPPASLPPKRREKSLTLLGHKKQKAIKKLEVFPCPGPEIGEVTLESEEVTSLCPMTGQPDWYKVTITYDPVKYCLESKSLKLYLWTFREEGHFCEALSCLILRDIQEVLKPASMTVRVRMRPRGGVEIESVARSHAF